MLVLIDMPDADYKRLTKAPRAAGFEEACSDRTLIVTAVKKGIAVKPGDVIFTSDLEGKYCDMNFTDGGKIEFITRNTIDNIRHAAMCRFQDPKGEKR